MPRSDQSYTPATLQNVQDHDNRIHICCEECGHGKLVPLQSLIDRFGLDYPVPELGRHFTCAGCVMADGVRRKGAARVISR
jgi:hypothetical protein